MKATPYLTLLFAVILCSGCATGYRPAGWNDNGYSDMQLSADEFDIMFKGDGQTTAERVADYTVLHAADVAAEHGFAYFAIISPERRRRNSTWMSQRIDTEGNSQTANQISESESARFVGITYAVTVPPVRHKGFDRQLRFRIQCFNEKVSGIYLFDAKLLQQSIRAKYGIK